MMWLGRRSVVLHWSSISDVAIYPPTGSMALTASSSTSHNDSGQVVHTHALSESGIILYWQKTAMSRSLFSKR